VCCFPRTLSSSPFLCLHDVPTSGGKTVSVLPPSLLHGVFANDFSTAPPPPPRSGPKCNPVPNQCFDLFLVYQHELKVLMPCNPFLSRPTTILVRRPFYSTRLFFPRPFRAAIRSTHSFLRCRLRILGPFQRFGSLKAVNVDFPNILWTPRSPQNEHRAHPSEVCKSLFAASRHLP